METEQLYDTPAPKTEPETEEEVIGPEPDAEETATEALAAYRACRKTLPAAVLMALVAVALLLVENQGIEIPIWTGDPQAQSGLLLALLCVTGALAYRVFLAAARTLQQRRCSAQVLVCLGSVAAAADCVVRLVSQNRSEALPYAAVSCVALTCALWGEMSARRGMYDTFRTASLDREPPYLVTETEQGACKQKGNLTGFYTLAVREPLPLRMQTILMPVVFVASVVFAGLSSLGQGRGADFFLNWSAILLAGGTVILPLCWGLPWGRLAANLRELGCAAAGYAGADGISRKRSMVLTDTDLFPPGTLQLNGVKVFGEEVGKAAAYAAVMAREANCGSLQRLFEGLAYQEYRELRQLHDFSFYEEGGYSAVCRGETILLGSASFMRKMDVRIPHNIHLKTGIFLALDHQLVAIFAVKYNAAANVDVALRMLRRNKIMPILATRDPNIGPVLLKRKFHKSVRVEYPDLTTRVALSEARETRGRPMALILREGLLPYAEIVVGSQRLRQATNRSALLGLFSSVAGTLLVFYLVSLGSYGLLTPLALLVFLLLWTLPLLMMTAWMGHG